MARQEARDAVAAVSDNAAGHSAAALRKESAALRVKCEEQLHQQHFLRQSSAAPDAGRCCRCLHLDISFVLHDCTALIDMLSCPPRSLMDLTSTVRSAEPIAQPPVACPGTWQAGVRAPTSISAALGVWAASAAAAAAAAAPQAGPSDDGAAKPALDELPAVNAAMLEARFRAGAQAAAGADIEQQAAHPAVQLQGREAAEPAAENAAQEEAGSSGRQQTECLICYNAMEFAMVR